jgi:APA family basic amino acid/polyamine antiporter
MGEQEPQGLVRAMGRWSLTALVINSIIGSGIFGLPSVVAGYVGRLSPLAYLFAAAGVGVIVACFAEVSSQFGAAGGPYLYARKAFGRFVGIEIAWLLWLVRLTAAAAAANLFTNYLTEFWPAVQQPGARLLILALLIGFIAAVNVRGVKSGAAVSSFFAGAKLVPLLLFVAMGAVYLLRPHPAIPGEFQSAPAAIPIRNWGEAVLILMFSYGGFEGAVVPMAEAKDPRHDAPFALFFAMVTVTLLYCAIQYVVVAVLPEAAATSRPLADAARQFAGSWGSMLISAGALISLYGYMSAQMLHTPRLTFALGENGDFPRFFARIHPRFLTPHVSIAVFAAIVWCLAAAGDFKSNVILSVVGRLFVYGFTCAALPVLRRKFPVAPAYRLPAGDFFAGLGIFFVLLLAPRMNRSDGIAILGMLAIGLANWLWARNQPNLAE